jgi:hypothetical protein
VSPFSNAPDLDLGADLSAGAVNLRVVAAKKPEHWIVRGFSPFTDWGQLRRSVERYVGMLDETIEWSHHQYGGWPAYVVYGEGDLPRIGWPTGIYRFDYTGGQYSETYKGGPVRLGSVS